MTDGVLLRELANDFLLSKYSVIIVDEAHERSMNTDILIGVLSRVMKLREDLWKKDKKTAKPLRLIIMSATLRISDFVSNKTLFPNPPPIINVDARQYSVTIHFNRRTVSDYVNEAVKKAIKIHSRLPPGGILIFLTGQNEIQGVCKKLGKRFGWKALEERRIARLSRQRQLVQNVEEPLFSQEKIDPKQSVVEPEELNIGDDYPRELDVDLSEEAGTLEDPEALDSDSDSDHSHDEGGVHEDDSDVPMHIIPLYSLLPSEQQMRVFEPPPAGSRLVVVATNVAETSLTIPGIKYVIETGRAKQRQYEANSGIETFRVSWISKASAAQRAGRAGRTGPGHCYRLYSSAFFENYFEKFDEPEILRMPIEGVVLQMKAMHIDAVVNFPFPTPPNRDALKRAETILTYLGALEHPQHSSSAVLQARLPPVTGGQITDLGRAMSLFPVSPRFSKMLVIGRQHGCLPYTIALVASMSVGDPFLREDGLDPTYHNSNSDEEEANDTSVLAYIDKEAAKAKEIRKLRRSAFFKVQQQHAALGNNTSDTFRMLSVVGAFEYAGGGPRFCADHFVRPKAMEEIHKLRFQLSNIVQANFADVDAGFTPKLPPPDATQLKVLKQLLTASFVDQVAVRKDLIEKTSSSGTRFASCRGVAYRIFDTAEDVFIHPSSVLFSSSPPDWVVYTEVVRTSRVWIKTLTIINPGWLPKLGKPLCTFSKPLDLPASAKKLGNHLTVVKPRFGPQGWELPNMKV
ncbi:putative ATP-dependent RNA helicase DHR1 [Tulasnella sp. 419]|nr:putative ATP-dependent RNA helicase DHR1 [Tulasnella sp. 419]